MSFQWLDIQGMALDSAVDRLRQISGAEQFVCSADRYRMHGFKGECTRLFTDGVFVAIHPDVYCPVDILFAADFSGTGKLKKRINDLEHKIQSMIDIGRSALSND